MVRQVTLQKNVPVKEVIPKLPAGIVLFAELDEVRQPFVARSQSFWRQREKFPPVRVHFKWRLLPFDDQQQLADRRPIRLQGEVNGNGILLVARENPEIVGCNEADPRNQQMKTDL